MTQSHLTSCRFGGQRDLNIKSVHMQLLFGNEFIARENKLWRRFLILEKMSNIDFVSCNELRFWEPAPALQAVRRSFLS